MRALFFFLCLCFVSIFVFTAQAAMQDYPIVKLQALDKSTARTVTFEAKVGTTIEYGSLFIKIQACRKAEPLDPPESAAFLQIWEVPLHADKSEWVFSGWMFASSPALSAMDHAVYDVWVLDCLEKVKKKSQVPKTGSRKKSADQAELEPVQKVAEPEKEQKEKPVENKESQAEAVPASKTEKRTAIPAEKSSQPIDNSIESVIENLKNNE